MIKLTTADESKKLIINGFMFFNRSIIIWFDFMAPFGNRITLQPFCTFNLFIPKYRYYLNIKKSKLPVTSASPFDRLSYFLFFELDF